MSRGWSARSCALIALGLAVTAWSCSDDAGGGTGGGTAGEAGEGGGSQAGNSGGGRAGNDNSAGSNTRAGSSNHNDAGNGPQVEGGTGGLGGAAPSEGGAGGSVQGGAADAGAANGGAGGDSTTDTSCGPDTFQVVGRDGCFECPGYVFDRYGAACTVFEKGVDGLYSAPEHHYDPTTQQLRLRAGAGLPVPSDWGAGSFEPDFATPQQEAACNVPQAQAQTTYSVDGLDLVVDLSAWLACDGLTSVVVVDPRIDYGCVQSLFGSTYITVDFTTNNVKLVCEAAWEKPPIIFGRLVSAPHTHFSAPTAGTVADSDTGLVWEQHDDGSYTSLSHAAALTHCSDLTHAGFSDWRLPNPYELLTIMKLNTPITTAVYSDLEAFPGSPASSFWASPTWALDDTTGWVADFAMGSTEPDFYPRGLANGLDLTEAHVVRCVRAGNQPQQRFTDNGNGTVLDHLTGSTWERSPVTGLKLAVDAQAYCRDLPLASGGWRVPTVTELESLIDYSKLDPAIDTTMFPGTMGSGYWATTPFFTVDYTGWGVDFWDGLPGYASDVSELRVRCVR